MLNSRVVNKNSPWSFWQKTLLYNNTTKMNIIDLKNFISFLIYLFPCLKNNVKPRVTQKFIHVLLSITGNVSVYLVILHIHRYYS